MGFLFGNYWATTEAIKSRFSRFFTQIENIKLGRVKYEVIVEGTSKWYCKWSKSIIFLKEKYSPTTVYKTLKVFAFYELSS